MYMATIQTPLIYSTFKNEAERSSVIAMATTEDAVLITQTHTLHYTTLHTLHYTTQHTPRFILIL